MNKYEGYSECNFRRAVTKEAIRKKINYIQKNMYILKLLLNLIIAGIEALIVSGNKFLYACVKEVCRP
jgi:hypothetical protein